MGCDAPALLSPFALCLNPDWKDFKDGRNVVGCWRSLSSASLLSVFLGFAKGQGGTACPFYSVYLPRIRVGGEPSGNDSGCVKNLSAKPTATTCTTIPSANSGIPTIRFED